MHWLPEDEMTGMLVGRAWIPSQKAGQPGGPGIVALRADGIYDLSSAIPTMSGLLDSTDPVARVQATTGRCIGTAEMLYQNSCQLIDSGLNEAPFFWRHATCRSSKRQA